MLTYKHDSLVICGMDYIVCEPLLGKYDFLIARVWHFDFSFSKHSMLYTVLGYENEDFWCG